MSASSAWFGLLDLLLVFAAVGGFAWWQLRDLAREKRASTQRRRNAQAARGDEPDNRS
jgi:uncharacterized membrane-anchored protein